jgi:acyl-CoA synthetase (AMP-forming)/AMP-acid ligase II
MTWLHIGEMLRVNAVKFGDKEALKDANRSMTFREYNDRACRLANALTGLGLRKGDRICALLYNNVEYMEIYAACAKAGLVCATINYRFVGPEVRFVAEDSGSRLMFVGEEFIKLSNEVKPDLSHVQYIVQVGGETCEGYLCYEDLIRDASPEEPRVHVDPEDPWLLLYTSGTTGRPKGVLRSHESYISFFFINEVEFGYRHDDVCMIVMPLFHVNSTFYSFVFTYIGAKVYIHRAHLFDPEEVLQIIEREGITFTSLIPTHYVLMLNLPADVKAKYKLDSVRSLLCSSAPARKETKLAVMEMFPNADLFEAYGSTEAGLVTTLRPEDQYSKLGSIGRECYGSDLIRLLDENGREVGTGEVGEIWSRSPMMFTEYWGLPEKTAASFRDGGYFSAGDLGVRDEDGYFSIVDRKDNMIITGGEHVYPTEVEKVLAGHNAVMEAAIVGLPDAKWGESVHAAVILREGQAADPKELIEFCKNKMAGYKKPKGVTILKPDEMPRTATGKIRHRMLREQLIERYGLK